MFDKIIQHIEFMIFSIASCGLGYLALKEGYINLATVIIGAGFIILTACMAVYNTEGE